MYNDEDFFPYPYPTPEPEAAPPEMTFFGLFRGVGKLGLAFSLGLSLVLAGRVIPAIAPFSWIVLAATGALVLGKIAFDAETRWPVLMLGTLFACGAIAGWIDLVSLVWLKSDPLSLAIQLGAVLGGLLLVALFDYALKHGKGGDRHE